MGLFFKIPVPQKTTNPAGSFEQKEFSDLLTKIRCAQYNEKEIYALSAVQYTGIQKLVQQLGDRILRSRSDATTEMAEPEHIVSKFHQIISALFARKSKFAAISFAAQLLQYYTIICHADFEPGESLESFCVFLDKNRTIFGEVADNVFIAEYQLVKIYNDILVFADSRQGKIAPIQKLPEKIKFVMDQLLDIKKNIDQWQIDAPDDVFVIYLNFFVNYALAQAVECEFYANKQNLSEQEKNALSEAQHQVFLPACAAQLKRMDLIIQFSRERGQEHPNGSEFSFGMGPFHKMPGVTLADAHLHIDSLSREDMRFNPGL